MIILLSSNCINARILYVPVSQDQHNINGKKDESNAKLAVNEQEIGGESP